MVPRNIITGIVIVPRRGRSDLVFLPVAVHDFGQVLVESHPVPGHGTRCRIGSSVMLVLVEDCGVHALAVSIVSGVELVAVDVVVDTIALVVPRRRVPAIGVALHVVPVAIIVLVSSRGHAVETNSACRLVGREGQGVALPSGGTEAQGVKGQLAVGATAAAVARDGGDQDDSQGGNAGDGADDHGDVVVGSRGRGAGRGEKRGGGREEGRDGGRGAVRDGDRGSALGGEGGGGDDGDRGGCSCDWDGCGGSCD